MLIRTIEDLDNIIEEKKKEGCNHSFDDELFLSIMALGVHHPEKMADRFRNYIDILSESGKVKAAEQLINWINVNLNV